MTAEPAARRTPLVFLRRALADQRAVGAVAPTSAVLGRRIAALVPDRQGVRVLELGAGTGAISRAVAPRLGPTGSHLAVERDPALLAALATAASRAPPSSGVTPPTPSSTSPPRAWRPSTSS